MLVRREGLVQLTVADHSPDPNIQDFAGRTAMELAEHLDKEEEEKEKEEKEKEEEEEEPAMQLNLKQMMSSPRALSRSKR